jgi:ATP-binding cassette subfamily F protein uup
MALVSLKEVTVAFGGPPVLDKVSLSIEKGERSCVTGRNGEGKSTLLKVIAGEMEVDAGEVIREKGIKVIYVGQEVKGAADGGRALSGGQIKKRQLEEALLQKPDLLLLDEPTNHLDIETVEWLENSLRRLHAAVLFVTHDRAFLKRTATRVLDLDRGELAGWDCDYRTFVKRKAELLADEAVYWERKSKKLAQEEAWIRRGVKARTTRNEGRVAALMELRREFAARRSAVGVSELNISAGETSGMLVLKADKVSFSYPDADRPVISDFTCKILRGERIGITGGNGSGKTTLLNLLTERLAPDSGEVVRGTRVELAYLDQLREGLDPEKTVLENIAEDRDEVYVAGVRKHVYSYLQDFLFTPQRARTPVKALSGGERARLILAKRFMDPGNLLVLDEPTNDLDIETLELLEEQLMAYKGTILLVSHDREFLDNVVTSCFVLAGDGEVVQTAGGYAESKRIIARAKERAREQDLAAAEPKISSSASAPVKKKLSYKETRELEALPEKISTLEAEIAQIESTLADASIYAREPAKAAELTLRMAAARDELDAAETRWLELSEV